MNFVDKLFYVWLYSGVIYALYFIFAISKSKKYQDKAADLKWFSGFNDDQVFFLSLFICFAGGLYYIVCKIFRVLFKIKED